MEKTTIYVEGNIRRLMASTGLSRSEFAKQVGISKQALDAILEGSANATLRTLIKMANRYKWSVDWFLTAQGAPHGN